MDEVLELCRRVLGQASSAQQAAAQARAEGRRGRVTKLAAAIKACRALADGASDEQLPALPPDDQPSDSARPALAAAVARELSSASARLPEREREVLALRELLRLSYKEIARVMAIKPTAVPMLLAEARLRLQVERRGTSVELGAGCAEGERALRLLARRQDSEPVSAADQEWLLQHMAQCEACERAHAAMLEASVCYRAWLPEEAPTPVAEAVEAPATDAAKPEDTPAPEPEEGPVVEPEAAPAAAEPEEEAPVVELEEEAPVELEEEAPVVELEEDEVAVVEPEAAPAAAEPEEEEVAVVEPEEAPAAEPDPPEAEPDR